MRTAPPFRADHVGSLLRPPELLEARDGVRSRPDRRRPAARGRGRGDPRRGGAPDATPGCSRPPTASSAGPPGTWTSSTSSAGSSTRPATSRSSSATSREPSSGRRRRCTWPRRSISTTRSSPTRSSSWPRRSTAARRRSSPSRRPNMVHYRGGRAAVDERIYPDMEEFWSDLSATYADELRALGELGCTYLQFDDTSLAYLNDPAPARADQATRDETTSSTFTSSTCATSTARSRASPRGWRSPPISAGATSAPRGRPRAATTSSPRRCSAASASTASSSSTTTPGAGGFEPLRFVP